MWLRQTVRDRNPLSASKRGGKGCVVEEFPSIAANRGAAAFRYTHTRIDDVYMYVNSVCLSRDCRELGFNRDYIDHLLFIKD